jgi:hypothetical protein
MSHGFESIRVAGTGTTVGLTTSASAAAALPTISDGSAPRFVRVLIASGEGYVKFGGGSVAATLNDCLLLPNEAVIFAVRGQTHFSAIARTGTPNLNIVPIDV